MTLLEAVKLALRYKGSEFDDEILGLIQACKADLGLCGIRRLGDSDPLIRRAVIVYCKANFGSNPDRGKLMESYALLKCSLALAGDYNE